MSATLLQTVDLTKAFEKSTAGFRRGQNRVNAVNGVSISVNRGETLGLVGESGSGKTTVARMIARLTAPTSGQILFDGDDISSPNRHELKRLRQRIQMVFQDPYSSFSPRASMADSLAEPLRTYRPGWSRGERANRMNELFDLVGLSRSHLARYPAELSGGQLQRAAVARALAVEPALLVLDEPVSALDVSTQAVLINLLEDLQQELGVSYLMIAHDLSVVRHMSHRIAVMYMGRVVEQGQADDICDHPAHPYTQALLSAVPYPDPKIQRSRRRIILAGDVPSTTSLPQGCHFHPRCPDAWALCSAEDPEEHLSTHNTIARCHLLRVIDKRDLSGAPAAASN